MMEISTTNIYDDKHTQRREKRRILVNLVVLSVSFMINYSAVNVFSLGDDQVQDNVECGATFYFGTASSANNTNLERPSNDKIYTVVGIYLGCIAVATCIVAFGLESLKR
ncbi:unnamed protein product [Timema podura]|uniref:Uncharacterized protein n=1 Tax=Timema podura TaxID=61482 RepID=A0ABN7NKQ2_TIMPD|nr:unnamed protein product [Timema podura]